jgi:hypothetical protein
MVCRWLGVQYLWIESLCIIQDDENDWEEEASRMDAIYENAFFTIAAHGESSDDRLLPTARDYEIPHSANNDQNSIRVRLIPGHSFLSPK